MAKAIQNHPFLTSTASSLREVWRHLFKPLMSIQAGPGSEVLDNTLDASSVVSMALRETCEVSTVRIANIAADIVNAVQSAKQNKEGLKRLADYSYELVIAIIVNIPNAADVPSDLAENLEQLVDTLSSIQRFARKSASRTFCKAVLLSSVDALRIQGYRERLRQSMRVFRLQSEISLRVAVAKINSQQVELMEELKKGATPGASVPSTNASPFVEAPLPPRIPGQIDSAKGPVAISGDTTEAVM